MSDRIRTVLEKRIITGELPPGARLRELEIAAEFNTSQTPVREALEALQMLQLVESERYRGTYVRSISDQEMEESYAVRGVLEQFAAELAAPRLNGNVSDLRDILTDLHAAARAGDAESYARHNDRFHRRILEHSGNQLLLDAWTRLGFETRVRIHLSRHHESNLVDRAGEHDAAVDALERGNGVTAGRILREHAAMCIKRWKERLIPEDVASQGTIPPTPAAALS